MAIEITEKHFRLISTIAGNVAASTGILKDDLEAEAVSKIPTIIKNFNKNCNVPFDNYFNISIRGYCLNYRRDKSFISAIPRSELSTYLKVRRYKNLDQASSRMGLSKEYLENLTLTVSQNRNFSNDSTDDEWKIPIDDRSDNPYVETLKAANISCAETSLLEDLFLDKKSNTEMIKRYGLDYKLTAASLIRKLKESHEELHSV